MIASNRTTGRPVAHDTCYRIVRRRAHRYRMERDIPKARERRSYLDGRRGRYGKVCLLVKLNRRVGNTFAAYSQVARQVGVGGWALDPRQVSSNFPLP